MHWLRLDYWELTESRNKPDNDANHLIKKSYITQVFCSSTENKSGYSSTVLNAWPVFDSIGSVSRYQIKNESLELTTPILTMKATIILILNFHLTDDRHKTERLMDTRNLLPSGIRSLLLVDTLLPNGIRSVRLKSNINWKNWRPVEASGYSSIEFSYNDEIHTFILADGWVMSPNPRNIWKRVT